MFEERPMTRKRRLAEEATQRMLEQLLKYVYFNRYYEDRHAVKLIGAEIDETVFYNGREYAIKTSLTPEDVVRIRRETLKRR